jgi:hypothetical protein
MKPATLLTVVFLVMVCVAHLLRLLYRVEIVAGGVAIPQWASAAASLVTAALAGWLWRERRR